jgi:hypothetical protein
VVNGSSNRHIWAGYTSVQHEFSLISGWLNRYQSKVSFPYFAPAQILRYRDLNLHQLSFTSALGDQNA